MAQTLSNLLTHVIFSTKDRRPIIPAELKKDLHAYMGGIVKSLGELPLAIGGIADHVHLLLRLPPRLSVSDAVRTIKARSSHWMHEQSGGTMFSWQTGYRAFSVSLSNVDTVARYIANQEIHHRKCTFQDEYIKTLKLHDVEYDERYIWS